MGIWKGTQYHYYHYSSKKCKLKPSWDYNYTPTRMFKLKIMRIFSVSEDVGKNQSSYIAGWSEHFYNNFWKHLDLSTEIKLSLQCDVAIPLCLVHTQINLCICPQKYTYTSANSSFIHSSQYLETIEHPRHRKIDKYIVAFSCKVLLHNIKRKKLLV